MEIHVKRQVFDRHVAFAVLAGALVLSTSSLCCGKLSKPRLGSGTGVGPTPVTFVPPFISSEISVFAAVQLLLVERLGINVGNPLGPDTSGPGLRHFQLFQEQGSSLTNSMEMHSDGMVYIAYTPQLWPRWYATFGRTEPNEADDHINDDLPTAIGTAKLEDLKAQNIDANRWVRVGQAFPLGRGPQPRWLSIRVPVDQPPASWGESLKSQLPRSTSGRIFLDYGAACDGWQTAGLTGPPEWVTVLPVDTQQFSNGQRKYFPTHPLFENVNGTTNFFVTWTQLYELARSDELKFKEIIAYRGVPTEDDYDSRTIPWMSSVVEGVVTNSFLSGGDYRGDHAEPPCPPSGLDPDFCIPTYWLGTQPPQQFSASSGPLSTRCDPTDLAMGVTPCKVVNSYADDWVVFVKPDPDYLFMLASHPSAPPVNTPDEGRGLGNYDREHKGNLENEIEEWLLPGGFRPEAGDRALMLGRWVVDCGHDDWHSEIHPMEVIVSQHTEARPGAMNGIESVAHIVITGDWNGSAVDFDVWPPPRPSAHARLGFEIEPVNPSPTAEHPRGTGIIDNISIVQNSDVPTTNPNHRHFGLALNWTIEPTLPTRGRNNVEPDTRRRLAATVHLWWQ